MELISREEVLKVLKENGPCLPRVVVKTLGKSDTMMVGAVLSELISAKLVKVTNTKIGTSPVYFLPGQESRLTELSSYINQKDKRAYDLLLEKKVIRDNQQEPLMRVSLRTIKDFSVPIEIKINGNKETFWKWYMLSNEEAIEIIRGMFGQKPKQTQKQEPLPILETKPQEEVILTTPKTDGLSELPNIPTKKEVIAPKQEIKLESNIEQNKPKHKIEPQEELNKFSAQNQSELESTEFLIQIRQFFFQNNITIEKEIQIKKNSEYDFLIKIPSAFGKINFFCKAKSKKKNNEQDVAAAYLAADEYRLPTIFLATGEFTKKAINELEKFKQITIKQI